MRFVYRFVFFVSYLYSVVVEFKTAVSGSFRSVFTGDRVILSTEVLVKWSLAIRFVSWEVQEDMKRR